MKIVDTFKHQYNHQKIYFYVSTLFTLRASRSALLRRIAVYEYGFMRHAVHIGP
jgi:hypothetical protein